MSDEILTYLPVRERARPHHGDDGIELSAECLETDETLLGQFDRGELTGLDPCGELTHRQIGQDLIGHGGLRP